MVPQMVPETLHQLASILHDPLLRRLVYEWDELPLFLKQAIAGLVDGIVDRD